MNLFLLLLPVYLLGNIHCLGMCGPLVVLLGKHPYRHLYFFGRTLSYAMAAGFAGAAGAVLNVFLNRYHFAAGASLFFGAILITLGISQILGRSYPGAYWLAKRTQGVSQRLGVLMMQNRALPAFLFGFCTVLLPCGQTLLVFSACALEGDMWIGAANGVVFSVLTAPSLYFAMSARSFLQSMKGYYQLSMGMLATFVGVLALLRGLAELGCISHCVLSERFHLVLF